MNLRNLDYMFPTSVREVEALGWDYIDVILFTGDAFVDHPSFGTACIARYLQHFGYRVAVVPQPNWRDDLRDFRKLGAPRLYFGVNAGAMDSMVNHYTAGKRLRHDDAYTPEGKSGQRPDYAVSVYSKILKELYPDVPVVIGGVEASLRRLAHYDYWKDELLPSILAWCPADYLCYGMGERPMLELTRAIEAMRNPREIRSIPQIAFRMSGRWKGGDDAVVLDDRLVDPRAVELKLAGGVAGGVLVGRKYARGGEDGRRRADRREEPALLALAHDSLQERTALAKVVGALAAARQDDRVEVPLLHLGEERVGAGAHAVGAADLERAADRGGRHLDVAAAQDVDDGRRLDLLVAVGQRDERRRRGFLLHGRPPFR